MPIFTADIPLSLYIHLPWCVQKCPYCDFNSHTLKESLPEDAYIKALLADFDEQYSLCNNRPLISLFFGGGTPSLFSGQAIERIIDHVAKRTSLNRDTEITLEANPGTVDEARFKDFRLAGVNRLSLGIQSLQNDKLQALGRIHDQNAALSAIEAAKAAGFLRINGDLMFALPHQTIADALSDLQTLIDTGISHLSWYQLTIEPNTLFHHQPPPLPNDDYIVEMQQAGAGLLAAHGLQGYEVSAYAKAGQACQHNLNYWTFGDYLGIGAGAHSKLTHRETNTVERWMQPKHPQTYLRTNGAAPVKHKVDDASLIFEFMLNALRLTNGVDRTLFHERTGLDANTLTPLVEQAVKRGLLETNPARLQPTAQGRLFLNDLMGLFLPEGRSSST